MIKRYYYLFDAKETALGRLATQVATILRGKNKVDFTPNIDAGDFVIVVNTDRLKVTGKKMTDKAYYHFSGYPGGAKKTTLEEKIAKDSREVIKKAVYGMLPKNKLRNEMLKRLLIFKDENHGIKEKIIN